VLFVSVLFTSNLISADVHQEISFRIEQGKMVSRGSIGKYDRLNLVIDTGATTTVIHEKLAQKLGLKKGKEKTAVVYGQRVRVQEALLPELSLGPVVFREVPVLISVLNVGLQFPIDALIGMELLKRQALTIDYSSRTIRFGPVLHSASSFRVNSHVALVFVYLTVEGGRPLRLMLDTGAEDLILYRHKVEGEVALSPSPVTKSFWGAGGRAVKMRGVFLSNIAMKDTNWDSLPAFLLDAPESAEDLPDGIVGASALELKTLNLDFQQGVISWTL